MTEGNPLNRLKFRDLRKLSPGELNKLAGKAKALGLKDQWFGMTFTAGLKAGFIDRTFKERLYMTRAYWELVEQGLDAAELAFLCRYFHGRVVANEELRRQKWHRKPGRPRAEWEMFLEWCDFLVSDRRDKRRFYRQFRDLTWLVFDRRMAVDSFTRLMQRVRCTAKVSYV
jgi:hypothetical protein